MLSSWKEKKMKMVYFHFSELEEKEKKQLMISGKEYMN